MSVPTASDFPYTACFYVQAAVDPGVMPRVLELFAKRGLIPTAWHSAVGGPEGDELHIDIQMSGIDTDEADYVARCLRQVTAVMSVLTSDKGYARRA